MNYLDCQDILDIRIWLLEQYPTSSPTSLGALNPIHPRLLNSAIALQTTKLDGELRNTTVGEVAGALFFGLVKNHIFENGNKRTALTALALCLGRNGVMLSSASQEVICDFVVATAQSLDKNSDRAIQRIGMFDVDATFNSVTYRLDTHSYNDDEILDTFRKRNDRTLDELAYL